MPAYFSNFNFIEYDVLLQNKPKIIRNITQKVDIIPVLKRTREIFIDYSLEDGETAEEVADKIYGNPDWAWVVWLMNDVCNPYYDWLITSEEVEKLVTKRYGDKAANLIHHYELESGLVVDQWNADAFPVTNRQHEVAENEKKRRIKVLDPRYLNLIEDEVKTIFAR